jgi:acyl-CoA reductase-like NAD-dependent aldehyde dehydrogenase
VETITMSLPLYTSFIDGKTVECARSFFDLVTPHDGQIVGRIAEAGRDGVDIAVKAASLAFVASRAGWRANPHAP